MRKNLPFRLLTISLFIGLIISQLVQDGMFMDGVIYAAVSRNLANGLGSFWSLTFSETFMTNYSEQLPLFFGIQALFFRTFGDSIYAERIFLLVMACITAFNLIKIWQLIHRNNEKFRKLEWLPVLLWVITPVVFWAYANNVQETLMSVFATASVYFILRALLLQKKILIYLLWGGLSIFACSFCKGFQGLFPLVSVALYWLFLRKVNLRQTISWSFVLLLVPLCVYGILLLYDPSYHTLTENFNNRIVRTFTNPNSSTASNRFQIIFRLISELLPAMGAVLLIYILQQFKRNTGQPKPNSRLAGFFIAIGVSASFPLMITSEQRGFYLVTSIPFFALGLAVLAVPYLHFLLKMINEKSIAFSIFRISMFVLLTAVIVFSGLQIGKTKRDRNKLHDVYTIGHHIANHSIIGVRPALRKDYSLVAYFARHFNISLDMNAAHSREYYLKTKERSSAVPQTFEKVDLELVKYELFEKVKEEGS